MLRLCPIGPKRDNLNVNMNPLFAILESSDYAIIAVIVLVSAAFASFATRQRVSFRRVERKLDALLQHHEVKLPSRLSPEVECLATDPTQKIAAIKLHREQNPELSLAEAKLEIENVTGGR